MPDRYRYDGFAPQVEAMRQGPINETVQLEITTPAAFIMGIGNFDSFKTGFSGDLSYNQAIYRAAIEYGSFWSTNPNLVHTYIGTGPVYRLTRTLQLAYGLKREGAAALIGSSVPHSEILGVYMKPPELESLEPLFRPDIFTFLDSGFKHASAQRELLIQRGEVIPPFIPTLNKGSVTAIDRDTSVTQGIEQQSRKISIQQDVSLNFVPLALNEAAKRKLLPGNLNLALFHRAEPDVFYNDPRTGKNLGREGVFQTLKPVMDALTPDGMLIVTVGVGRDKPAQQRRIELLRDLRVVLTRRFGHQILPGLPLSFTDKDTEKVLFGGHYGSIGAIASKAQLAA